MARYQRIRDLREDSDLTQSQTAEKLFMHPGQYARYERGERELPLDIAVSIADHYGVSLDYLAGRSNLKVSTKPIALSAEEIELIKRFRSLSDFEKGQVYERISAIAEKSRHDHKK